jgi:Transglutaminase-like superfamily
MALAYATPAGIHARRIGDAWVFLDVARDRYVCLTGEPARRYTELIDAPATSRLSHATSAFAQRLTAKGLLTTGTGAHDIGTDQDAIAFRGALNDAYAPQDEIVYLSDIARFMREFLACCQLRHPKKRCLSKIIEQVKALKATAQGYPKETLRSAASLTRSFQKIVPWFYSAHDACFFSSMLLMRFLARSGVSADWVFGVRMSPFRAHCWVAHDGLILNEDSFVVAGFDPILVV